MTQNYFAVERSGQCVDHVNIKLDDGTVAFEDVMNMSYDEMKIYSKIDEFVTAVMDATNQHFGSTDDEQTIINLVGEDDVFNWGILIGPGDVNDELRYAFIDWHKDGKSYRYKKD